MGNYCDFNPGLFRQFISKKVKIFPAMSDDWVIIPAEYVKDGGFSLKSEKLNQEVADINLLRFLQFCAEQKLVIDSLKLIGNFIVGNDRSVYTEAMYNEWVEKFTERTETIINVNDAIPGHQYKTPCGMTVIYMGFRYISRVKLDKSMSLTNYSTVSKVHFIAKSLEIHSWQNTYQLESMKVKFTTDEGAIATPVEIDVMMDDYYTHSPEYVIFSKAMPKKGYEIGLVEAKLPVLVGKKSLNGLIAESKGKLYCADGINDTALYITHYIPKTSTSAGYYFNSDVPFDRDTLTMIQGYYNSSRYRSSERPVDKLFRLGIIN
jgi:hypothetical protein